jgi:hypothetical protein
VKDVALEHDDNQFNFLREIDGATADNICTYVQVLDFFERDNLSNKTDTGHLCTSDSDYCCATFYLLVNWEIGETTYGIGGIIAKDDSVFFSE